ncbi:hydroxyacylglutathione hydrolase [Catenovulum sp. SM1970]|nr:hydroxyacylglutathione hydrolase [Marinifaba aquimaris]
MQITPIKAFSDNYIWQLCQPGHTHCVVIDPGQSEPVLSSLLPGQVISEILITHHHYDHTDGVKAILEKFPSCKVYGPKMDKGFSIDVILKDGEQVFIDSLNLSFQIKAIPGHTLDHISYYAINANQPVLFCGDTLFSAGCGRMFEGTEALFWSSLKMLKQYPENTQVYCTHEYTQANLKFANFIEPNNVAIAEHIKAVDVLRKSDTPSLPSNLKTELAINPFLKSDLASMKKRIAEIVNTESDITDSQCFGFLRKLKDNF